LAENGLFLETVTISKLDQTDEVHLKDTNIFDARGRRKIAEVTQENLTERNRLVREGEQARKAQDVSTQKNLLAFEQDQAFAAAKQASEVAKVKADTEREAREAAIVAQRQVELAEVDKSKMLEVAAQKQQETVAVAQEQKQQAIDKALTLPQTKNWSSEPKLDHFLIMPIQDRWHANIQFFIAGVKMPQHNKCEYYDSIEMDLETLEIINGFRDFNDFEECKNQ